MAGWVWPLYLSQGGGGWPAGWGRGVASCRGKGRDMEANFTVFCQQGSIDSNTHKVGMNTYEYFQEIVTFCQTLAMSNQNKQF